MNAAEKYDVLVLGAGTAGKLMAWTMAKEGKLTRRDAIGDSGSREPGPISIDMAGVNARKREMVEGIVQVHLDKFHVALNQHRGDELILGDGAFVAPRTVRVALRDGGERPAHSGARYREARKPRDNTRHARSAGIEADDTYRGAGPAAASRALDRPGRRLCRPGNGPGSPLTGKPRNADRTRLATCRQGRCRRCRGDSAAVPRRRH